jgi:hypothetical protein
VGAKVALSGSTKNILAPGVLLLEARPAGTSSWLTLASGGPGTTTMSETDYPVTNTTYRLRFLFAGATGAKGTGVPVGVRHKVKVSSTSIKSPWGHIRGVRSVPRKVGGVVEVWTDRAGNRRAYTASRWAVRQPRGRHHFRDPSLRDAGEETYRSGVRRPIPAPQRLSPRITVSSRVRSPITDRARRLRDVVDDAVDRHR